MTQVAIYPRLVVGYRALTAILLFSGLLAVTAFIPGWPLRIALAITTTMLLDWGIGWLVKRNLKRLDSALEALVDQQQPAKLLREIERARFARKFASPHQMLIRMADAYEHCEDLGSAIACLEQAYKEAPETVQQLLEPRLERLNQAFLESSSSG